MAKAKSKTKAKSEPEVQAIPTIYAGIEFRSRLEASVAQFFNKLGWNWEYEPKSFLLPSGVHYRPDFYVKRRIRNLWVECRGYTTEKGERQINEFPEVLTDLGLNDWYLVLHSGEEYGCTVSGAGGCSAAWLYRCQSCGKYGVFGAAWFEPICENCGCVSQTLTAERIDFCGNELHIGDFAVADWSGAVTDEGFIQQSRLIHEQNRLIVDLENQLKQAVDPEKAKQQELHIKEQNRLIDELTRALAHNARQLGAIRAALAEPLPNGKGK